MWHAGSVQGKIWDCIVCIQKSGTRLDLVYFSSKQVGSYFRKVSGLLRYVDEEGVAWK